MDVSDPEKAHDRVPHREVWRCKMEKGCQKIIVSELSKTYYAEART